MYENFSTEFREVMTGAAKLAGTQPIDAEHLLRALVGNTEGSEVFRALQIDIDSVVMEAERGEAAVGDQGSRAAMPDIVRRAIHIAAGMTLDEIPVEALFLATIECDSQMASVLADRGITIECVRSAMRASCGRGDPLP